MEELDNKNNEIIDISSDSEAIVKDEVKDTKEKVAKEKKNKPKRNMNNIFKNKKLLIILGIILLLIVIVLILLLTKNHSKKSEVKKEDDDIVIKENYRYENGKLIFLDKMDKEIGSYKCQVANHDTCFVAIANNKDDKFERVKILNSNNEEIEVTSPIYLEKYVFITDNGNTYLYDIESEKNAMVVKSFKTYSGVENIVVIEDENSKFGLVKFTEDEIVYLIRPTYDDLGIINDGLKYLVAKDKDVFYIVNEDGKKLSKNFIFEIMSLNDKYIVAKTNNSYNLYNYNYEELESDYEYISLHDNIVAFVKNNRLLLKDNKLNKLHEDGIRLENNNYVKSYVYDSNNKLQQTNKAYDITYINGVVTVTIGNTEKTFNISDGEVNKKYSYLNYFDGKLYFYSDIEKDELMGTYTCNNKNIINSTNLTLDSCRIMGVNNKISGIYNNNYVFIDDNYSSEEKVYGLYSIKDKKVKGSYSSIEFINDQELADNTKLIYTSSSFIIAKSASGSNKGNYGILEINSEKVVGKVPFKYASIAKEGNYYIMENHDKKYSIYNKSFSLISDEFDYVKLYDNYYVGIKDKSLNVYNYLSKNGVIHDVISIDDFEYKIDFTNGFTITIKDSVFEYDINGNKKVVQEENNNNNQNIEEQTPNTDSNEDKPVGDNNEE